MKGAQRDVSRQEVPGGLMFYAVVRRPRGPSSDRAPSDAGLVDSNAREGNLNEPDAAGTSGSRWAALPDRQPFAATLFSRWRSVEGPPINGRGRPSDQPASANHVAVVGRPPSGHFSAATGNATRPFRVSLYYPQLRLRFAEPAPCPPPAGQRRGSSGRRRDKWPLPR